MANVLSNMFADIAGAIREKTGDTATMKPAEFAEEIRAIESGGNGVDPYYSKIAYALVTRNPADVSGNEKVLLLRDFTDVTTDPPKVLGNLQPYSMAGFSKVEAMAFSSMMMLNSSDVFYGCTNLKILDFTLNDNNTFGIMIGEGLLNTCNSLQSIIVRGNTSFSAVSINPSHGSTANFYIYVPRANYNNIISRLSSMSNCIKDTGRFRILENYPDVNNWEANYT